MERASVMYNLDKKKHNVIFVFTFLNFCSSQLKRSDHSNHVKPSAIFTFKSHARRRRLRRVDIHKCIKVFTDSCKRNSGAKSEVNLRTGMHTDPKYMLSLYL